MPRPAALVWLGLFSLLGHLAIAQLSTHFVPGEGYTERPIRLVLLLFGVTFLLYFAAIWLVRPQDENREARGERRLVYILVFAVLFRLVHVAGNPIQEIDSYRYLWDGRVTLAGVNPYAYSPEDVVAEAGITETETGELLFDPRSDDGRRLARVLAYPSVERIFRTVDHRRVPTVYPPLSQAVFALATALTPVDLPPTTQIVGMKLVFLAFDLGVIAVLVRLLRAVGKPPTWCLAYAWCPLVLKEVANSGHLDVIAVFFTTLTAYLLIRGQPRWAALAWAAAILSKLYPVVLLPLIVRQLWDHGRWKSVTLSLGITLGLVASTYALAWPPRATTPLRGLQVFLTEWEMNDLLFHLLYQGADAALGEEAQQRFVGEHQAWWPRRVTTVPANEQVPIPPAFVLSYLVTGGLLAGLTLRLALRRRKPEAAADSFLQGVFLTLAILFLLSPTANPWYVLWAIPFLPWARRLSWYLLSGVVFHYYLRFWFIYHYPEGASVFGTGWDGHDFFNQVWLWVEYAPFLVLLAVETVGQRRNPPGTRR